MSGRFLALALFLLGLSALAIGTANFAFGPARIAAMVAGMLVPLAPETFGQALAPWTADGDNEMRFYAVFWIAYGIALLFIARDTERFRTWVPLLLGLFFLGGVGRAISVVQLGWPHPLFAMLMAIELALPVVLLILHVMVRPLKTPDFGR